MRYYKSKLNPWTKRLQFINPARTIDSRVYGVIADGVTDDSAALQSAIDDVNSIGGGNVTLPNGTIVINSTIDLKQNVGLLGENSESTLISYTGTGKAISLSLSSSQLNQVVIGGFELQCTKAATDGIYLRNSQFTFLRDLVINNRTNNGTNGLTLDGGCHWSFIRDSRITGKTYAIKSIKNGLRNNTVVFENLIYGGDTIGIYIDDCKHTILSKCSNSSISSSDSDIKLNDCVATIIENNYLESKAGQTVPHIRLSGSSFGVIIGNGNYIGVKDTMGDSNSTAAIVAESNTSDIIVVGNYFFGDAGGIPIRLEGGSGHIVANNRAAGQLTMSGKIKVTQVGGASCVISHEGFLGKTQVDPENYNGIFDEFYSLADWDTSQGDSVPTLTGDTWVVLATDGTDDHTSILQSNTDLARTIIYPVLEFRLQLAQTTTTHVEVGLYDNTSNKIVFKYDTDDGDSNWQCVSKKTSETSEDSGIAVDTSAHTFKIYYGADFVEFYIDGTLVKTISTNIPTSRHYIRFYIQARTNSTKTMWLDWLSYYAEKL